MNISKYMKILRKIMNNYNILLQSALLASSTYLLLSYFPGISIIIENLLTSLSIRIYNKKNNDNLKDEIIIIDKQMIKTDHTIEICISDIESIRQAILGGVTSLEICSDRSQGGITPSIGLVEEAIRLSNGSNIEINVLIRPRPGLFTYTDDEFNVIIRDIIAMINTGATGIVCGILTKDGKVDVTRMKIIRKLMPKHMKLTFHRAFDICIDTIENSIEDILSIPCDRLLTSGKSKSVADGLPIVKYLISTYVNDHFEIIVGSGITKSNIKNILTDTGITRVHIGSAATNSRIDKYIQRYDSNSWDFIENDVIDSMNRWDVVDIDTIINITLIITSCWFHLSDNEMEYEGEDNSNNLINRPDDPMNESVYLSESYYNVESHEIS